MQAREQRHLGRFAKIGETAFHFTRRFGDLICVAVRLLLQDRQMPDRLIELEIFFRLHRFGANFTKALQIF